ncbi:single-strand selective monofunctional uracil DNA glycosylase [Asbolus verrucosus]|uniref:Single-strand selective monofunctional uracil DNA glycosylase n=1 Tax=Asbolus verrucosus TaxID=1661398 RepID=A0A482WCG6_ASBVE|nr:single-strand selective monofunctional uracil DNA glycosylase [Asbolus verrucosus]
MFKKIEVSVTTMLKRKLSKASLASAASKNFKSSDKNEVLNLSAENSPPSDKSEYFPNSDSALSFEQKFLNIQLELNSFLKPLTFKSPVAYVYNPVEYAYKANEKYIMQYCKGPKKLLFVGMNPGPFGMCQTGVPFGEIKIVRDWLKIEEEVGKPEKECPKKPVLGFACPRSEVSGDRLWNVFKKVCGTPEVFFKHCFVYNYCPIALLKSDGSNLTPSDIKDSQELEDICDKYYFRIIQLLQPEIIVGIGRYAEKRTLTVLKSNSCDIQVLCLVHPSPRVVNNQNWPQKAETFLKGKDLLKYMTN